MTLYKSVATLLAKVLGDSQRRMARHACYRLFYRNDLARLALFVGSDKEGSHHYCRHYQHHFEPVRNRRLNLLEIGIGGDEEPTAGGGSLRMWKAYFPNSRIYGIDIHDKTCHEEHRIRTFRGSQADAGFLHRIAAEIGAIDIIIDDGSHRTDHVITSFQTLFPLLNMGGIYVVEDLQTSYWPTMCGRNLNGSTDLAAPHTSMNYFKRLVDGLNHEEFLIEGYEPTYFDEHIVSMHFYHNMVFVYKGRNNEGSNLAPIRRDPDQTS